MPGLERKHWKKNHFGQIFHLSKDQSTYNWNALGREYPINLASGSQGSAYTEVREQSRDVPLHLHGSQKDLLQDWSFEPRSVW